MVKIAIIEDEERDYLKLKQCLDRYSKEQNVFFDIARFNDAVNFVSDYNYSFDLIFLDIMMPDINGMQAAEKIRQIDKDVTLIFVTNMEQFAVQGYNVAARYFILKPFNYEDFAQKLGNTLTYISKNKKEEVLMLHLPFDEMRKINVKDIRYIEVFSHDIIIHLFEGEIKMRGRLSDFEKQLNPHTFFRVKSCYIINLSCVKAVKDGTVSLGDVELNVSHARKKALLKALSEYIATEE